MTIKVLLAFLLAFSAVNAHPRTTSSAVLSGPYLGQEPPGSVPEIFGPGVISVEANFEHSAAVFSPDGDEVFWCTNVGWYSGEGRQGMLRLYFMKQVDGNWTEPRPAPFAADVRAERPVFSPDGKSLYFEAFAASGREDDVDIFVVHRTPGGWSDPVPVSPFINTAAVERLHCVTADGSMYFTRNLLRPDEEIFVSRFVDGAFTVPETLGRPFDSEDPELAFAIGPDEDYILVSTVNAERTSSSLFITYRRPDGTWTERIKTPYYCGGFLALSPDSNYLFMLTEDIYWVDTSFVERLRP